MQLGVNKAYALIICLDLDKANLVLIKHMLWKNFVLVFILFSWTYWTVNYSNALETNCKIISVKALSVSAISFDRTLVYQAVFEIFVLIQQRRKNDLWYTYQHCLIPKLLLPYPKERSRLNAVSLLLEDIYHKKLYHKCDCDCVPLLENQLGRYRAYENFWSGKSSPSSPDSQPPSVSVSVPIAPAVDPSPTFTPTPSPALLEDFRRKNKISDNFTSMIQFDVNFLSGSNFQIPQQQTNSADFKTPNCLETPEVCAAPKKTKRQKDTLTDFFEL